MARKTPEKTPKKGRPHKSVATPGIYLRGDVYWLRYSHNGEQIRISLDTIHREEAIKRAEELRNRPVVSKKTGQVRGGKTELERALDRYIQAGGIKGKMGKHAKQNASQAIRRFSEVTGVTDPARITTKTIKEYYEKLNGTWIDPHAKKEKGKSPQPDTTWKKSESTAQTYSTRVATFARWAGFRIELPHFPPASSRDIVIPAMKVDDLLEIAEGDLKFVLLAGFRGGLRRGEIAWARPSWFVIESERPHILIPKKDPVTGWIPKSKCGREIPLTQDFKKFILKNYPDWATRAFCIRPEKQPGKWIYRFDDRKMFKAFTKVHSPQLTHHVMRHTYASLLADGGIGIVQLSAWTGDKIKTLEKHYLHIRADAEKAEEAFSAHRRPTARQAQDTMAAKLQWMQDILDAQAAHFGLSMADDTPPFEGNEDILPIEELIVRKLYDY